MHTEFLHTCLAPIWQAEAPTGQQLHAFLFFAKSIGSAAKRRQRPSQNPNMLVFGTAWNRRKKLRKKRTGGTLFQKGYLSEKLYSPLEIHGDAPCRIAYFRFACPIRSPCRTRVSTPSAVFRTTSGRSSAAPFLQQQHDRRAAVLEITLLLPARKAAVRLHVADAADEHRADFNLYRVPERAGAQRRDGAGILLINIIPSKRNRVDRVQHAGDVPSPGRSTPSSKKQ